MSNDNSSKDAMRGDRPLTLALDTATPSRSVALARGSQLLAEISRPAREAGASTVLADIDATLRAAGVRIEEVDVFAAVVGPGSFTGIRAGLATIKALASTLKKPAVGIGTLYALAHTARPAENLLAVLPAGRGELFAQRFSVSESGEVSARGRPAHVSPVDALEQAASGGGGLKWVCGCAQDFAAEIVHAAQSAGLRARAAAEPSEKADPDEWLITESHGGLAAAIASSDLLRSVNAVQLKALYVRASDAELKDVCQAQGL